MQNTCTTASCVRSGRDQRAHGVRPARFEPPARRRRGNSGRWSRSDDDRLWEERGVTSELKQMSDLRHYERNYMHR